MLSPDGDLVRGRQNHLPVLQPPFMLNQPSLEEDVVREDVDHNVVTGVYLRARISAAADDVLCIQLSTCSLHQHVVSAFFATSSFLLPTQRRFLGFHV